MHQYRKKEGQDLRYLSFWLVSPIVVSSFQSIPHTHYDTEGSVSGNRCKGPYNGCGETISEYIYKVLPKSKAHGYCSGIYNGIILAVELRTVPGPLSQKEILGAFFTHSHNYVVEEYVI